MTTEAAQLVGLSASIAAYSAAVIMTPWVVDIRMRHLEPSTGTDHESRKTYTQVLGLRPIRSQPRWLAVRIVPVVLASALYALVGTSVSIELGVCLLLGALLTTNQLPTLKERSARLATSLKLGSNDVESTLRPAYLVMLFTASVGMIGIGCFLGGLLGLLL